MPDEKDAQIALIQEENQKLRAENERLKSASNRLLEFEEAKMRNRANFQEFLNRANK